MRNGCSLEEPDGSIADEQAPDTSLSFPKAEPDDGVNMMSEVIKSQFSHIIDLEATKKGEKRQTI